MCLAETSDRSTAPVTRREILGVASGSCPPSRCAKVAKAAAPQAAHGVPTVVPHLIAGIGPVRQDRRSSSSWRDLSLPLAGLRQARRQHRRRPHGAPPSGADASVQHQGTTAGATGSTIKTFSRLARPYSMPDGKIVPTAPTGHTYTTEPHGAAICPRAGARPLSELDLPAQPRWTQRLTAAR